MALQTPPPLHDIADASMSCPLTGRCHSRRQRRYPRGMASVAPR
jgi:hypothetical protein